MFDLKAKAIHSSFHIVKNVWKKILLAHNYADHELLKKHLFFLLYVFNVSLLLSPYGDNIHDSTKFLLKEEIYFAEQKN